MDPTPLQVEGPSRERLPHPVGRLPDDWRRALGELGHPRYRADQIFRWIHKDGVLDPADMSNLPKALRDRLGEDGLSWPLEAERVVRSRDGTRKISIRLSDGLAVECVLIPRDSDDDSDELDDEPGAPSDEHRPVTLCVSTQVGCAMGCVFCASGQAGLRRGLGAHEVLGQVLLSRRYLDSDERLRNLVFMGMGEPLHHYEETARSIRLLTHPLGIAMSPRRITVSTVGLIPGIEKLGRDFDGKVGLAISLHAPDSDTRSGILPMNRRFPLPDLMQALRSYPLPRRRRITIEYTLIDGVNDTLAHATQLAELLRSIPAKVNLIPMNPIAASALSAPRPEAVEAFRRKLGDLRVSCSVRKTRGDDVDAACGQLALKVMRG